MTKIYTDDLTPEEQEQIQKLTAQVAKFVAGKVEDAEGKFSTRDILKAAVACQGACELIISFIVDQAKEPAE